MTDFTYQEGTPLTWAQMNENLRLFQAKYLDASNNAAIAIAAANFRGAWSGLSGALAVPAAVYHAGQFWILLSNVADVTLSEPGVSAAWASTTTWVNGVGVPTGGTTGQLLAKLSGTDYATQWIDPPSGGSNIAVWNPLVNGAFGIKQDTAASFADDTYAHDQWYVLTQTGAIAVSTLTNVEDGLPTMARLTQSQVTSQRMGYAQIIEGRDCKKYRGKQVTFRFGRERMSAAGNIRIAVLEWTGAEDVVTSDVVNSWTSGTYTPGNFFLGSNLAVSGIVAQTLAANTLTDGTALTVTLGSTFNNLIVFVWTESAVAQNVTLDLGLAQIDMGATARPFEHRPYAIELMLCHRYYYRINATAVNQSYGNAYTVSTTVAAGVTTFPVAMRAPPTALEQSGTAANYSIATPTLVYVCTAVPVFNAATTWNATTVFTSSGMTASIPGLLHSNAIGAYLAWSARL